MGYYLLFIVFLLIKTSIILPTHALSIIVDLHCDFDLLIVILLIIFTSLPLPLRTSESCGDEGHPWRCL